MFKGLKHRKLKAYTLNELMIVMVIIGILALIALPRLLPLISKARSTEAKLQLRHVVTLQETYFFEHSKYASSLSDLGYEQSELSTEDGAANYIISLSQAGNTSFTARATAVVDFDGDGTMNIWEIDQDGKLTEVQKD